MKKSFWKQVMHYFDERMTLNSNRGRYFFAKADDFFLKACYCMGVVFSGDKYRIGSWYGNDTIWRTVVDLNDIVLMADKDGIIKSIPQRKVLTIADMIICGQTEGPVAPSPKKLNMIMMGENTYIFDKVMCEIMGFDSGKVKQLKNESVQRIYGYDSKTACMNTMVATNINEIGKCKLCDFRGKTEWRFEPHSCWKGHIEKKV